MARSRAALNQSELTSYAKAMRAAKISEWRVEAMPDGKRVFIVGKSDDAAAGPDPDELLK